MPQGSVPGLSASPADSLPLWAQTAKFLGLGYSPSRSAARPSPRACHSLVLHGVTRRAEILPFPLRGRHRLGLVNTVNALFSSPALYPQPEAPANSSGLVSMVTHLHPEVWQETLPKFFS